MQNKGAIRLLIITLILVTIYQLSFTFVALDAKQKAKAYATDANGNVDYSRQVAYLDSLKNQDVYNLLIVKYTLGECQARQINLGLDLQGGMNVMLQVSVPSLLKELANNTDDPTFNKAFAEAVKAAKNNQKDFLDIFYQKYQEVAPNGKLAAIFAKSPQLRGQIDFNKTNDEVIAILREQIQAAIDNSFNVLRTRIDRFGVTQPNIQKLEGQNGRILVELPGVKDEERVRKLLQQSASLEFYLTYEAKEIWPILQQIDQKIVAIEQEQNSNTSNGSDSSLLANDVVYTTTSEVDTSASLLTDVSTDTTSLVSDTTQADLTKDEYLKKYPFTGRIYPAMDQDKNLLDGPVIGYVSASDTGAINKYLAMPEVQAMLPQDLKLAWTVKPDNRFQGGAVIYDLIALKSTADGKAQLGGDVITNARHNYNQNKGSAEVTMIMNASAAKRWAELTRQNIGKSIAIVLDGNVYSYPTVQSEIPNGVSQITGQFTIEEAQDLANVLKSGKLPVKINIVELNHVGPSLGKESINAGLLSFLLAFIVVLIYMILYYNKAGWVADIALLANMFFMIGVLASLGAVLTLPGIAGIVLTIGMSVDANVIIYERIREELRGGKGIKKAVEDGYSHAYSAIIDANVTTLLTGIILYIFGHGPIQGFATTLIIGIFTSLFSAIFVTRIIFDRMLNKGKEIKFWSKWSENILNDVNINFLGKRKIFYIVSSILLIVSIGSLFVRGLDLGVDFVGGRTYIIRFEQKANTLEIATILQKEFGSAPEVKTFGSDNQVKITTKYKIDSDDPNVETEINEKLYNGLKPYIAEGVDYKEFTTDYIMSAQKVGPTIASDIKTAATYSVIFALLVIFLYIFLRFKNWQYGLGATVALLHDSVITLGMFSLLHGIMPFSLEIDQAFIAAILTVVGYSVNDTVIIFDRIREYLKLHPKRQKFDTINSALNSTLSRTLNTSLTTFFVLLVIFLFGGTVIRGFVFALLIGIIVGTYSSLYIASPITFDTIRRREVKEETKAVEEEKKKQAVQQQKEEENLTPEERQKRIEEARKKQAKKQMQRRKKKKAKK
jgi:SecD/SecF fusion protein